MFADLHLHSLFSDGTFTPEDNALLKEAQELLVPALRKEFDRFAFHRGLETIWKLVNAANAYIDVQAPWALKKTDENRMKTVLYVLTETIRCLGISVQAVVPESGGRLLDQVAVPMEERTYGHISAQYALKSGTPLPPPEGVFPRIQTEEKAA